MGRRNRYPGNGRHVSSIEFGPGSTSVELATSMAMATLPFSPMAAGVHDPSTQPRGYAMVQGYGVNRMGNDVGPIQNFYGAVAPIAKAPKRPSAKLGIGAGVAGQPGMPSSGMDTTGGAVTLLSLGQLSPIGMVGGA